MKKSKLRNQRGGAIEYALIAIVLLAIVVTAVKTPLNTALNAMFDKVKTGAMNVS